ncbi:hypothetical protein ACVXG8_10430 [Escherichia coli]
MLPGQGLLHVVPIPKAMAYGTVMSAA